MLPAGAAGAYTHWKLGNVRTTILAGLIAGILVGTYLCGTLAHFLSEATLRIVFAAMLIWTSLRFFKDKETDVVSWLQRSNTPFYRMK